jgi:hypothetical protein
MNATAHEATTMTASPAAIPSASQIGDTIMPASFTSLAVILRWRISIELGIGARRRARIPHVGGPA